VQQAVQPGLTLGRQRGLSLHLGQRRRLAGQPWPGPVTARIPTQVDELGPARDGTRRAAVCRRVRAVRSVRGVRRLRAVAPGGGPGDHVVHRAGTHAELVGAELGMGLHLAGGRCGPSRLEVDDMHPPLGIQLDPVHEPAQPDRAPADLHLAGEPDLRCDHPATPRRPVPLQEPGQRIAGRRPLLVRPPPRLEGQLPPYGLQPGLQRVEVGCGAPAGDLVGQRVHHLPEALRRGRGGRGVGLMLQEPFQRAGAEA
jgi:hypothetical protein